MKSLTCTIALGLLLCCLGTWANENEGICPPPMTMCATASSDESKSKCQSDSNCEKYQKCCIVECSKECINVTQVDKEGQCPMDVDFPTCKSIDPNSSERGCKTDKDCDGKRKCCYSGCMNRCLEPLEAKPGTCPSYDAFICRLARPTPSDCHDDKQCQGSQRCCCFKCKKTCTDTVRVKRGQCPCPTNPKECPVEDTASSSSNQNPVPCPSCANDGDCPDALKCCDSCGKSRCVDPIKEHPGQCPVNNEQVSCYTTLGKPSCCNDETCKDNEKCCLSDGRMQCVPAMKEKEGCCPQTRAKCASPPPKPTCHNDSCCEGIQKCCTPYCQQKCTDPIIAGKQGTCPEVNTPENCEEPSPPAQCTTDCDCLITQKCCNYGCGFKCVDV